MNFANYNSHAVPYFISANVMPINMLYVKLSSLLMHDVHNNLIPSNLSGMFTLSHQIHNHTANLNKVPFPVDLTPLFSHFKSVKSNSDNSNSPL